MLERINLIPKKPLAVKIKSTTPLVIAVLILLGAGITSIQTFIVNKQLAKINLELGLTQDRINENNRLTNQTQELTATINKLQKEQNALQVQVDNMSATVEGKHYFSKILAKITSALPASAKLDRISFQGNGGTLAGVATEYRDLPGLVTRLADDPLFASAALQDLGKVTAYDRELFAFSVVFELPQLSTPTGTDRINGQ